MVRIPETECFLTTMRKRAVLGICLWHFLSFGTTGDYWGTTGDCKGTTGDYWGTTRNYWELLGDYLGLLGRVNTRELLETSGDY